LRKLAIVVSHPIQYYAPVFKHIALHCDLMVFYTFGNHSQQELYDEGFKRKISWDLPLLENYNYKFVDNIATKPGHYFNGINNPTLINEIENFNPHALLIYGWAYTGHLQMMRHFHKKLPIWFRGDSTTLDKGSWLERLIKKSILTWVYQHVDLAFFVGIQNKKYFKKHGLRELQLIFAPHAIENERFAEDRSIEALRLRNDLGISLGQPLILFAGKFEEKKDPRLLVEAFINLNHPNAHLLFVGNGELEVTLKSLASSIKAKNIHFMDFQNQSQMPVVYQACDLFCLPSKGPGETWGLAVNEAMAAGKAVLVSDKVGCAQDLIFDGKNGYIFQASNQQSLKERLALILDQNLDKLGEHSKEIIKEWNFSNQVNAIIDTLERK
jgi:glycosyltransferase involved in cell wall biosynthesis